MSNKPLFQQHLEQWRQSGLSQAAYCREHHLDLNRFYYWKSQSDKVTHQQASGFIPARLAPSTEKVTLHLSANLSLSCQIAQLSDVLSALHVCQR